MPELQKNLSQHGPTKATASPKTLEIADAQPFPFTMPPTGRAALLMIDWQRDFLEVGGFGHALGNDVSTLRKGLGPAAEVLKAARKAGIPIVHTLEAHTPDLSDLPAAKQRRLAPTQRAIGEALPSDPARGRLLVAGEPGNAIVPEVAPLAGELILHKPGKGAFCDTILHAELRKAGITHLIVTGVTTEVCVQTTLREANDRGYDCLVVSDATESYFPHFKTATLEMVVAQGAIVGWAATSSSVVPILAAHKPLPAPTASAAATLAKRDFPLSGAPLGVPPPSPPPSPPTARPPLLTTLSQIVTPQTSSSSSSAYRTTLLAVSGTLQCGFELRGNMDHPDMKAVLIGSAVIRGVKAHLDVKEAGCREHRPEPERARVNPANVVTGNPTDVNLYAVYLVHEAVVLKALLGEPRYLSIAPDAVRVDLEAKHTSPAVRELLRAAARALPGGESAPPPKEASILTVLTTYNAPSFVPLQKLPGHLVGLGREGDAEAAAAEPNGLTSFPEGLASFAQVPLEKVRTPGIAEGALRKAEKDLDAKATSKARGLYTSGPLEPSECKTEPWRPRLAALWDASELAKHASSAGFGGGAYGEELAGLAVEPKTSLDWRKPLIVGSIVAVAAIALMRR